MSQPSANPVNPAKPDNLDNLDKPHKIDTDLTSTIETSNPRPIHNMVADTAAKRNAQSAEALVKSGATKAPLSPSFLNRRRFMQGVGLSVTAGAGLGLVGCGSDDDGNGNFFQQQNDSFGTTQDVSFYHGVASGDPLADKVILWTRVTPNVAGSHQLNVHWAIATDAQMAKIVAQGNTMTSAKNDYTVKVDVDKLSPNTMYYYQFSVGDKKSRIGKTKTLPINNVTQVKLAVFSCANYPAGFFHVYADAAKRNDLDACVHLGDYIYEYGRTTLDSKGAEVPAYASAHAAELKREVEPPKELLAIDDYRRRYAQYRSDKDLQDLHAALPMIAVWDDHELANDAYDTGAENHQPQTEGAWDARKLAAVTAYHEWMPIRNSVPSEIYRRFDFGNLVSLHMLDTRVIGRAKQLDYQSFIKVDAAGEPYIDAAAFTTATNAPDRQLLGIKQSNWLVNQLQNSSATWQILGQQVLMARMMMPAPVILNIANPKFGVSIGTYLGLANKAQTNPQGLSDKERAILAQPYVPYNLDAWDGYGSARELVLTATKSLNKNLVVLSGDTHNAWSSNLTNANSESVGVEFATSSVSSPGFEEYLPTIPASVLQSVLTQLITDLKYMDASQRGYMVVTATPESCQSDWIFVSDILTPTYSSKVGKTLKVMKGANQLSAQ